MITTSVVVVLVAILAKADWLGSPGLSQVGGVYSTGCWVIIIDLKFYLIARARKLHFLLPFDYGYQ